MTTGTVLVVEDDQDIRETLAEFLEDAGYAVRTAANGQEGLTALRRDAAPCVMILDLMMPVMTGNELYEAMLADPQLATVPVIVSTSDPSRAPSGVLVIKKPVDLGRLLDTVARFCRS